MDAINYLKEHHKNDTLETKGIVLAKYCTLSNNYKHKSIISRNLLNIVYSGTKILNTVHGDVEVRAGEAFFLTKGEYLMSEVIGEEEYSCLLVFFDDYLSARLFSELPFKNTPLKVKNGRNFFKVKMNPFIKANADSMLLFLQEKPEFSEELLLLKLKELMLLLLGGEDRGEFIGFFRSALFSKSDLASFMESNFERDLPLKELAALSGRSLSAFKSEFQKSFDTTPKKWIQKKRLEKGRFLIEKMGYDIGVAALSAGFKSHAHFTRAYKGAYGYPPSKLCMR